MTKWVKPRIVTRGRLFSPTDVDADALLASLMEEWPDRLVEAVPVSLARDHVAAMTAASMTEAAQGAGVSRSLQPTPAAAPRWRRRLALATVTSTFLGQLLLGTAAVAAVGAGAAAAGALPDSLQSVVSDVAEKVGIDLPTPASGVVPADPGGPGEPATPASPALNHRQKPEVPPGQAKVVEPGSVTPAIPATPAVPADPDIERLRAIRAVPATPASPALEHRQKPDVPPGQEDG
jgi:hypothetical protein